MCYRLLCMTQSQTLPEHTQYVPFRAPNQLVERVDAIAAGRLSSRSEVIRQLVLAGLEAQKVTGGGR